MGSVIWHRGARNGARVAERSERGTLAGGVGNADGLKWRSCAGDVELAERLEQGMHTAEAPMAKENRENIYMVLSVHLFDMRPSWVGDGNGLVHTFIILLALLLGVYSGDLLQCVLIMTGMWIFLGGT